MKKLIEFFKWDFEGEYQQYFYFVENEEEFIKEALEYLNTVSLNNEHFWSDCLVGFKEDKLIESHFLPFGIQHINEYYYIQDDLGMFTLTKNTITIKTEDIK